MFSSFSFILVLLLTVFVPLQNSAQAQAMAAVPLSIASLPSSALQEPTPTSTPAPTPKPKPASEDSKPLPEIDIPAFKDAMADLLAEEAERRQYFLYDVNYALNQELESISELMYQYSDYCEIELNIFDQNLRSGFTGPSREAPELVCRLFPRSFDLVEGVPVQIGGYLAEDLGDGELSGGLFVSAPITERMSFETRYGKEEGDEFDFQFGISFGN